MRKRYFVFKILGDLISPIIPYSPRTPDGEKTFHFNPFAGYETEEEAEREILLRESDGRFPLTGNFIILPIYKLGDRP